MKLLRKILKKESSPWAQAQAHVQRMEAKRLADLEQRERRWEVKRLALRAQERDSLLLCMLAAGNAIFAALFTLAKCGVL